MSWTTVEEMLVRELWPTMPSRELSLLIGKPQHQIRNRAATLGLGEAGRNGRRHGQFLVDHILKLYAGNSVTKVARMTDMTPGQVEGIIKRARHER